MEPEGSLSHSQVPATCPYPVPDQSSPCSPSHFLRSISILSSHLFLGLPSGLLPSGFPTKTQCILLPSLIVLHAPPISFFSIWSPEKYLLRSDLYAFTEVRSWHRLLERHVKTEGTSKKAIVSYVTVLYMHKSGSQFKESILLRLITTRIVISCQLHSKQRQCGANNIRKEVNWK